MKKLKRSDYGPDLDSICEELAVLYKYLRWTWMGEGNPPDKDSIKAHILCLLKDMKEAKASIISCGGITLEKSGGKDYKGCLDITFSLEMPYYCVRVPKMPRFEGKLNKVKE